MSICIHRLFFNIHALTFIELCSTLPLYTIAVESLILAIGLCNENHKLGISNHPQRFKEDGVCLQSCQGAQISALSASAAASCSSAR